MEIGNLQYSKVGKRMTWFEETETSHIDPTISLHRPHTGEQRASGLCAESKQASHRSLPLVWK